MRSASELFSDQQRRQVAVAVAAAESKTSCEIVPVVATASGRYDRSEDIVGLWLAVPGAIAAWLLLPRAVASGSWGGMPLYAGILAMIAAVVVAFVVGAFIATRVAWLRRLFTPRAEMQAEVAARARQVFFDKRVHHTSGATGLLVYVSLFEHIAIVLGDQQILDKLGQSFLDGLCEQLTQGLHKGQFTDALCGVVSSAGDQLALALPRNGQDVNELDDALVLID
jgi:putative membrane protein